MKAAPLRALADGALLARFFGDQKPEILALHGWGRNGSDFAAALEDRAGMAPDLAGFGHSPPPEQVWGADDYASQLVPVMEELRTPAVVVGHSFGGRVAACLAARRPDLVGGLLLSGAPLVRIRPPASPRLRYRLIRWGHRRGLISAERLEQVRRRHGSQDYREARGVMRDVLVKVVNESYEHQLGRLVSPVHLLWGADDREAPVETARVAHRILTEAGVAVQLDVIPGVGHDLPLTRPDILGTALDRMLEQTR